MGRAPARNAAAIHGYYRVSRPQLAPVMDTVIIAVLVAKPRAKPSIPAVTAIAMIVCFGLCPCQHNGTYTRNVYPATPTKKPAQILHFAEGKKSRFPEKSSEKRLKKPWVKVQVHQICQSPFWHLFVAPLKMGAKKPGSR